MNPKLHAVCAIAVMSLVTAGLRFAPFLLFGGKKKTPPTIDYLGRVLPPAIMAMLVVYCLKGVRFTSASGFVPELLGCLCTAGLHAWKRNILLSILCGTALYMCLVQLVF